MSHQKKTDQQQLETVNISTTDLYFQNQITGLNIQILSDVLQQKYIVEEKISNELKTGNIQIKQTKDNLFTSGIKKIAQQIHEKQQNFNKQLQILKWSLRKNSSSARINTPRSQSYQNMHKNIPYNKTSQFNQQDIQDYKNRQKLAAKRLMEIKKCRQIIQLKNRQQQERKRKIEEEQKRRQQSRLDQLTKIEKNKKLEQIQERMRQLSERKKNRIEVLKKSSVKSTQSLPKYKVLEKQFQQEQQMQNSKKWKLKKEETKKKFHEFEPESLKAHEKQYMQYVRERLSKKRIKTEKTSPQKEKQLEDNFRPDKQNPEVIQQKRKLRKRVKQFQKIVNHIKLKTNLERQLQVEIAKDKAKNPFKYHVLKQKWKDINDYQIYKDFQNYDFDRDSKMLGNRYFKQFSDNMKQSRVKSSASLYVRQKTQIPLRQRPYKNYLEDAKKNTNKNRKKRDSVELLLHKFQKSKVVDILQNKSQNHRLRAIKKIGEWKEQLANYEIAISTEQQIDEQYMKSIKEKLKCISIKN